MPVELGDPYPALLGRGYAYGPVFQGLHAAWQSGDDVYADVRLPADAHRAAEAFAVHPALLDAALHPLLLVVFAQALREQESQVLLPFSWSGVSLHALGATALRVRITRTGPQEVALRITDHGGAPVLSVESLALMPASAEQLAAALAGASAAGSLLGLDWTEVPLPDTAPAGRTRAVALGAHSMGSSVDSYRDLAALRTAVAAAPRCRSWCSPMSPRTAGPTYPAPR